MRSNAKRCASLLSLLPLLPYPHLLGQGKIDFPKVVEAIAGIGFSGWAQLETVAPSGNVKQDMKTNLDFMRGLLART